MGSAVPYRIDLADDEIESIRTFDVDTQRTIYKVKDVRLLPAREFPMDEAARTGFRARFRETFEGDPSKSAIYKDISNGIPPAGIEYYLPLFFEDTGTLFDYLPARLDAGPASRRAARRSSRSGRTPTRASSCCAATAAGRCCRRPRSSSPPSSSTSAARDFRRIDLHAPALARDDADAMSAAAPPELAVERRAPDPLHRLKSWVATSQHRVLLLAESAGRRETMLRVPRRIRPAPEDGRELCRLPDLGRAADARRRSAARTASC